MRRRMVLLIGGVVGGIVGLALGWAFVRPSGDDLVRAARELVPEDFTVVGQGVHEGNVLLGWEDVAGLSATSSESSRDEVVIEDLADAAGWTVVWRDPSTSLNSGLLERSGLEARVTVGTEDGAAEVLVLVQRDGSEWWRVVLALLVGAGAGAGLGLTVGSNRTSHRRGASAGHRPGSEAS